MSAEMLNELYELVVSICDKLYVERRLITKKSIKKLVLVHGNWEQEELEIQIPRYMNEWRLNTLEKTNTGVDTDQITKLRAQVCKCKADLLQAQETILRLQVDIVAKDALAKKQQARIIEELRGMLG